MTKVYFKSFGFTIVELLVVIVIIGILAAITIVSYSGIASKASGTSLQSDLNGASKKLKLFMVDNGHFPTGNNCPSPGIEEICLTGSSGTILSYTPAGGASPQTFSLTAAKSGLTYVIDNNSAPTLQVGYSATGGTITYTDSSGLNPRSSPAYTGGYTLHTFTTTGTLTVTGTINNASVLIVGGGGGGGGGWGGGGGGGQVISTTVNLSGNMTATVGSGGALGTSGNGISGNISTFGGNTSIGGGYGGYTGTVGGNGACGGGRGGGGAVGAGGIGSPGFNGGGAYGFGPDAGGGGGMGSLGINGSNVDGGGSGGNGVASSISGTLQYYGAGGGGSSLFSWIHPLGDLNYGAGGQGAVSAGSSGYAGIVIIRYPTP